jgi:tetratricopeptide (TPR) repeat protein
MLPALRSLEVRSTSRVWTAGTCGLLVALLFVVLPVHAFGQPPAPETAPSSTPPLEAGAPALANQRYLQGREAYRAGRLAEAAAEFRAAFDVFPQSPRLAFNLGRSLERLGRPGEAATAYRKYVELAPGAEDAGTVEALARSLEEQAAARRPTLIALTRPSGASVTVDGVAMAEQTPLRAPIAPGAHLVVLRLDGYREEAVAIEVAENETRTIDLVLVAAPAGAGALVAPPPEVEPKSASGRSTLAWSLVGGGALAASIGAVLHSNALETADAVKPLQPTETDRARWETLNEDFSRQRLGASVSYGVGGALVTAGLYLLLGAADGEDTP